MDYFSGGRNFRNRLGHRAEILRGIHEIVAFCDFYRGSMVKFCMFILALKHIPMGSAYAVWTGIGAVGIAIVGIVWFSEPATLLRVGCIALVLIGIAGLKLTGSEIDIT